ncbi:hypothetical protein CPB84DRAFT_284582 [Gymnopilus junonius]|uniref:Uncharacterized protein n=1 Tax=Gymnopilus junonius TaxID=109634 RepID=A0A9P5NCU0_GYMJU|nr:hypothetical protein CPB84DRAFT_284582 [Gymnopilus junonius]
MTIERNWAGNTLRTVHASLVEFLLDRSRSGKYYLDLSRNRTQIVQHCIKFISTGRPFSDPKVDKVHHLAMQFFLRHCSECEHTPQLRSDVLSFDSDGIHSQKSDEHYN